MITKLSEKYHIEWVNSFIQERKRIIIEFQRNGKILYSIRWLLIVMGSGWCLRVSAALIGLSMDIVVQSIKLVYLYKMKPRRLKTKPRLQTYNKQKELLTSQIKFNYQRLKRTALQQLKIILMLRPIIKNQIQQNNMKK